MHARRPLATAFALAALWISQTACREAGADAADTGLDRPTEVTTPPPSIAPLLPVETTAAWREIDRLLDEQKLAEAARAVASHEERAHAAGDDTELARALVRGTQIAIALGGYESAVEALRAKAWPASPLSRATVELYEAHALVAYLGGYDWEIRQRERVAGGEKLDLELWTRDQIVAETDRAFARVWALRAALGDLPGSEVALLVPNNYPKGIRPTLRDAVAYLWADRLADSSGWSPEELQELWKLDLAALVAGTPFEPTPERLSEEALHPLAKIAALLGDLERWHRAGSRTGAAAEARIERHRILFDAFESAHDRARIRASLADSLAEFRRDPWWAMGQARLASFWRQSDEPDALLRAREIASAGERAFPDSPGALACRREREELEAPAYSLQSMRIDSAAQRSVEVTHRNLAKLHFRAFRIEEPPFETTPVAWEGWNEQRMRPLLARRPVAAWTADLPPTADLRDHRTFVTPPITERGRYLIVASADADFDPDRNQLQAVELAISELVLLHDWTRTNDGTELHVRLVSGGSGAPLPEAEVALYEWQWEKTPRLVTRRTTDVGGAVSFGATPHSRRGGGFAVVARHGGEETIWKQGYWPFDRSTGKDLREATLVFTDRSIYRPGQKLLWKTLSYRSRPDDGEFRAAPERKLTIRLRDPNGEEVASATVTTNAFGTASGELEIPTGRLLGDWRLETDANGSTSVAIEEYKRPTFEVALLAPSAEPRLNRPVELQGEARYYFGLPVASGRVAWRVVREPAWEWGWRGGRTMSRFWAPPAPPRTIASGASEPDADGKFSIRFTPEADEREKAGCGCFRYTVEAELTDDGGETRSGSRTLTLGWVGVRLALDGDPFLLGPESERSLKLRRTDLDGEARGGSTRWRIVELEQPARTPLASDLAVPIDPERERYATAGDRLRPRWADAPETRELVASWPERRAVTHGALVHGADGDATLALPALRPGAYRLVAETNDAHGELATLEQAFVVLPANGPQSAEPALELRVPLELAFDRPTAKVGAPARLLVHSGIAGQRIVVEIARRGEVVDRRVMVAGRDPLWLDLPVTASDRGGFGARATIVRDHQLVRREAAIAVPWTDKQLTLELSSFRDRLEPGQSETFRVTVKGPSGAPLAAGAAELVASMYDRSLDLFRAHGFPAGSAIYPSYGAPGALGHLLGGQGAVWSDGHDWWQLTTPPDLRHDSFGAIDPYGIGGPGMGGPRRMMRGAMEMAMAPAAAPQEGGALDARKSEQGQVSADMLAKSPTARDPWTTLQTTPGVLTDRVDVGGNEGGSPAPITPRTNFAETAFWQPHLVTDASGSAAIEFRVPESLTSWKLWISAWTKELASGAIEREVRTAKELMVRPYLPRFLREGDAAELRVQVNNGAERDLAGQLTFAIVDPDTKADLSAAFGLAAGGARTDFSAARGKSADLRFPITVPQGVRPLAFRVEARSGALSDGELRPLPVLPSRIRLAQSRFAAIRNGERRELIFDDMRKPDATRIDEQLVVSVDGQLFYGMLDALPYLVDYPYECTEQTMNRYVSTAILGSLFERYPAVGAMAKELAKRDTRWERFDAADPNRRMALEETPWLRQSKGGDGSENEALLRVLDPGVSRAVKSDALAQLAKAQLPSGAFPWFPGGPPSPYMTLYLMAGFAKAAEFGVEIPDEMVRRGWRYLAGEIERDWWKHAIANDCCWELLTFANYVASSYPDPSVMGDAFPAAKRGEILDFSFKHWKRHAPQSKLQLALTLQRMKRPKDARLVLDAVMDSAKSDRDLGTFWAPEDRAWLWYNDTIETHAWALRALSELIPNDPRREGLVQWLFLNKKLGHWKSTRATSEVLYSLAHYLESEKLLGAREELAVTVGGRTTPFVFEPDRFTGKHNQIVLAGDEIVPERDATTIVEPKTKGFAFASATWQFSTEALPFEARGDLFHVERAWFRRVKQGKETTLIPLREGERLAVGDELEIRLSIRAKAAAEYVHLRDPRPAGLEPDRADSGWKWDLGLSFYEETRDSGTNFFFEWLPAGEYTLKYRLRANVAGTFRAAPAQLQSIYAPEFVAYSAGGRLVVAP